MAYFAPYIDEAGIHTPTFEDIKQYYIDGAKGLWGDDVYLDADSMDGELISILAKGVYDTLAAIRYAYNNYSPATAIGTALSRIVKLSGVQRVPSGYSTVLVTLTGEPYTLIRNGVVADLSGNKWDLPTVVNLEAEGEAQVTAIAQQEGAITALPNTVTQIVTPTAGWTGVTNEYASNPSQPQEQDFELRARQRQSIALPSQGLAEGTESAILQLEGVTDAVCKENDTKAVITIDGFEIQPNTLYTVVEGGSERDIAETLFYRKNMGCYLQGEIEYPVEDRYNNIIYCRFDRPEYVTSYFNIEITPLEDYSTEFVTTIKNLVLEYIQGLGISDDVVHSVLYSIVNNSIANLNLPNFRIDSITMGTDPQNLTTNDINIKLNQKAQTSLTNITVEVNS